ETGALAKRPKVDAVLARFLRHLPSLKSFTVLPEFFASLAWVLPALLNQKLRSILRNSLIPGWRRRSTNQGADHVSEHLIRPAVAWRTRHRSGVGRGRAERRRHSRRQDRRRSSRHPADQRQGGRRRDGQD